LLQALLLQAFYTIRSETQLMEQLHYNLLYRWFVGLGVDKPVWVPTVFTKNRERLLEAEVAHKFLAELLNHKEMPGLLSDEHFSVDGTQVAAWASMKSFRAKDGSDEPPSGRRNGERLPHSSAENSEERAIFLWKTFAAMGQRVEGRVTGIGISHLYARSTNVRLKSCTRIRIFCLRTSWIRSAHCSRVRQHLAQAGDL
jgi:Transposase domain (DUF772)